MCDVTDSVLDTGHMDLAAITVTEGGVVMKM